MVTVTVPERVLVRRTRTVLEPERVLVRRTRTVLEPEPRRRLEVRRRRREVRFPRMRVRLGNRVLAGDAVGAADAVPGRVHLSAALALIRPAEAALVARVDVLAAHQRHVAPAAVLAG